MASKTTEAATPCECSLFDAVPGNLTEKDLADGSYPIEEIGCTATTKNTFAPGHDAKLKSFLIKQGFAGWDVRRSITVGTALGFADSYGFGSQVRAGIAKLQAKAEARAARAAGRKAPKPERKLAESAGIVVPAQPAKSLAEIVAQEEADHAAQVAANRPKPEWDDETSATTPTLEDEAAMNTHAREERERGLVVAKVGRWQYEGFVADDETFSYVAKDGQRKAVPQGKYTLV